MEHASEFYPRSDVMRTHDLDLKISVRRLLILVYLIPNSKLFATILPLYKGILNIIMRRVVDFIG